MSDREHDASVGMETLPPSMSTDQQKEQISHGNSDDEENDVDCEKEVVIGDGGDDNNNNNKDDEDKSGQSELLSSSGGGRECWLCRDGTSEAGNPLVTNVCRCRGSVGWIHRECLDSWVFSQRRSNCPGCGATYNVISSNNVEVPDTFFGEVFFLFWDFFLPLFAKILLLCLGIGLNSIVVPFLVGIAFYHRNVFLNIKTESNFHLNNTSLATDCKTNSFFTYFGVGDGDGGGGEASHQLQGAWLWFSVMIYGWVCVILWRCTRTGWHQWCALFTEENALETGPKHEPYTMVEAAHWLVDYCLEWVGCSQNMVLPRILELVGLLPLSIVLSFSFGRMLLVLTVAFGMIFWRFRFSRKKINDVTRRFAEVQERKGSATEKDIILWFFTYVCELALFSIVMAVCGGIVLHFALSPYLLSFPTSFQAFVEELSLIRLVSYWLFGTLCSMVLLHVETMIVVPLFAPGVELFFVRSVDLDLESSNNYWNFILAQVFDADPLRVFFDFLRLLFIEMTVLYLFLATPLYVAFSTHDAILKKCLQGWDGLSLPLASGFPLPPIELIINKSQLLQLSVNIEKITDSVIGNKLFFDFFPPETVLSFLQGLTLSVSQWLLDHPFLLQFVGNSLIFIGLGTAVACVRLYSVRHTQLKILRPLSMWIARYVVCMETFLFDEDRLSFLDRWLGGDGQDDIIMPEVPISLAFVRREWALPPGYTRPMFLKLRLALFSALFFVLSSTIFWITPVTVMTILLFFVHYSVPLFCCLVNLLFFVSNPRMYINAVSTFLLFFIILVAGLFMQPVLMCIPLKQVSRQQLVRETMEFYHNVRRTVGEYAGEPDDNDDEWESVSNSSDESIQQNNLLLAEADLIQ